jgi:hypothetical protein
LVQLFQNYLFGCSLFLEAQNSMKKYILLLLAIGLLSPGWLWGQKERDALAPKSSAQDALCRPLYGVTICTNSLEETLLFYRDGMGLSIVGPLAQTAQDQARERKMYDIPADVNWTLYLLERKNVPSAIKIRLMVLSKPMPSIHQSWNSLETGPFSLGFPNLYQATVDSVIRKKGFGAQAPMNVYPVKAADQSTYTVYETIFNGPDFVKGVGITRGDGMAPLSPVDSLTGMGGPGYSAMVLQNSQVFIDFLTQTLGLELRADRVWTTSGALGVPAGTQYRFALVYAKGAANGHLLLLEFLNQKAIVTGISPKIPNRGLGCWTFPCRDLSEVFKRAKSHNIKILAPPTFHFSPLYGQREVMTLLAPNGFLVEIFQE